MKKIRKTRKRFLAGLLSLCIVLTLIPVQAKAAEADTQSDESNTASVYELTENNGAYYDSQHVKYTLSTDGSNTATVAGYDKNEINDIKYTDEQVEAGNGWEITIPAKVSFGGTEYAVTEIAYSAFSACKQLTKTKFPKDSAVEKIGSLAFYSCSLGEITLPDSLTSIGDAAFVSNTRLKYIYIPKNVSEIKSMICYECTALTRIEISPENEKYYISDASNCIIDRDRLTQGCSTSVLPKGRNITINSYSFANMDITKVDFTGVYISKIEHFAFQNAQLLENWVFPAALSGSLSVSQLAFYASNGLKKVTIPDNVYISKDSSLKQDDALNTNFGSSIFSKCSSLEQVVIPKTLRLDSGIRENTTNYDFFRGCDSENLTVYVEDGANDYLMTALKNYAKEDWTGGKTTPTTNENGHFILKDAYRVQFAEDYTGYTLAKAKGCTTLTPIPGDSVRFVINIEDNYKKNVKVYATDDSGNKTELAKDEDGVYTLNNVNENNYKISLENYGTCGHDRASTYTPDTDASGNSILTKTCDDCGYVESGKVTAIWRQGVKSADSVLFSCDNADMKGKFSISSSESVTDDKDTYHYDFVPTDGTYTGNGSVTVTTVAEEKVSTTDGGITYTTVKSANDITTPLGNCTKDIYYDSAEHILYIKGSETYVVSGTTMSDRIVVENTKPATLVLKGVDIQLDGAPAIDLRGTADVTILLAGGGENTLRVEGDYAALQKNDLASDIPTLTINGSGSLRAISYGKGAGIGAEANKTASKINFHNARIVVESNEGCGIGAGAGATITEADFSAKDFEFDGGDIYVSGSIDLSGGMTLKGGAIYQGTSTDKAFDEAGIRSYTVVETGLLQKIQPNDDIAYQIMKGDVALTDSMCLDGLEVPKGSTLTVISRRELQLSDEKSMTNNGTLIFKGTLKGSDSSKINNTGTIYNYDEKSIKDSVVNTGTGVLHEDTDHDGLCDICKEDISNVSVKDYKKDVTVEKNDKLTLSATVTPKKVSEGKKVTYQWYKQGADDNYTAIAGATGAEYVQSDCALEAGEHNYRLQIEYDGLTRYLPFVVKVVEEHKLTEVKAKEATATEAGNKAYFVCDNCGRYFEDSEGTKEITDKNSVVIPAKGSTPVVPSNPGGTIPIPGGGSNPTMSPLPSESGTPTSSSEPSEPGTPTPSQTPAEPGTPTPSQTPAESGTPIPSSAPVESETPTPSQIPSEPNVTPTAKSKPVGTKLKDSTGVTYKVTSIKGKMPTVQYMIPKSGVKGTVTIPAKVTIGKVTYKVTAIADNAFKGNKRIKKVVIGSDIVSIGKNAFAKCKNLTSITIGRNVVKIGRNAFAGCKKLKFIIIKSKKLTMKSVTKGAFSDIRKEVIVKVPKSKYKAYKKLLRAKGLSKKVKIKKL